MGFKDKLGRWILSILFAGILFKGMTVFGAQEVPSYTTEQAEFLTEVKRQTLEMVEKQKNEGEILRRCFAFPLICPTPVSQQIPLIRKAIRQKSEEYRLLVGLSRSGLTAGQGFNFVKLGLTLPGVTFRTEASSGNPSEIQLIREVHAKDLAAMKAKYEKTGKYPIAPTGPFPMSPGLTAETYAWGEEIKTADGFYEMQALLMANQLPFIIYLDSDRHSDADIAKAMGFYVQRLQEALNDLFDEKKNPLESFLIYEPIVRNVLEKNPGHEMALRELFAKQKPKVGLKAWLARNSPSLRLAALSSCSLVAAIMQAWPISLACGGSVAALTSMQLYDDYYRMKEDFSLWLVGAQSHAALKTSEARILYSSFALFLSGQSLGATLLSIETGLVATLSNIPSTAAARFTSLTALREGGLRFASNSFQFKGKDLGASLLAQNFAEMTDNGLKTTRQQRIFTYADFLNLNTLDGIAK